MSVTLQEAEIEGKGQVTVLLPPGAKVLMASVKPKLLGNVRTIAFIGEGDPTEERQFFAAEVGDEVGPPYDQWYYIGETTQLAGLVSYHIWAQALE